MTRPVDHLYAGRMEAIATQTCRRCGRPATSFTDDVSEAEYAISGLCQECQDFVFVFADIDEDDEALTALAAEGK